MRTVAFIVNGGFESAMGYRARSMAAQLAHSYDIKIAYRSPRKISSIFKFFIFLVKQHPALSYVFDMAYAGVVGAYCYRLIFRNRLIIETGDAIYELVKTTGSRGAFGLWLTRQLEQFSLHKADQIVVRGSFHRQWLAAQGIAAEVIQDGVDTSQFTPLNVSEERKQYKLDGLMTIGLVGSSEWSDKLQMCYGWELVETLRLLKGKPVVGIMIGGGSGIAYLKARCHEYAIEDRMLFLGYVPYGQLPEKLNLIDVCLSTQTNNLVGQVRTTGKLPLYLATGRYVLASEVGEAKLVLNSEMLVKYEGMKDENYPRRLATEIEKLLHDSGKLRCSLINVSVAREHFDYSVLAKRMAQVIEMTIKKRKDA